MGGWGTPTSPYGWFTSVASQQKAYGDAFLALPGRSECEPGGDVLLRGCAKEGTAGTGDRVPGLRRAFRPRFAARSNLGSYTWRDSTAPIKGSQDTGAKSSDLSCHASRCRS